jgi:hypothetical protein
MLQSIKKFFSTERAIKKSIKGKGKKRDGSLWAERQIREMGKLGGKLILM